MSSSFLKVTCLFTLSILISYTSKAQNNKRDSIRFNQLILSAQNSPNELEMLKEAEKIAHSYYHKLKINNVIGYYYSLKKHDSDSALLFFTKNLKTELQENQIDDYYMHFAESYRAFGRISALKGNFDIALDSTNKAIKLFEDKPYLSKYISSFYIYNAYIYLSQENHKLAESWSLKLIDYATKINYKDSKLQGYVYLAVIYSKQNLTEKAKDIHKYTLNTLGKEIGPFWEIYVNTHNALGSIFLAQREVDSAAFHYQKINDFLQSELDQYNIPDRSVTVIKARLFNNLGNIANQQGDNSKALIFTKKSLELSREIYGEKSHQLIKNLKQLSFIYQKVQDYEKSEVALLKALTISKESKYNLIVSYSRLGDLYHLQKRSDKAEQYYDSALLVSNIKTNALNNSEFRFKANDVLTALTGKIKILEERVTGNFEQIDSVFINFTHVAEIIFEDTDSKAVFDRIPISLEGLFSIYDRAFRKTKKVEYLERLWEICDINKSKKLRGRLAREYILNNHLAKNLINRQKQLKDSINLFASKAQPRSFDSTLFKLKSKQAKFLSELEVNQPELYELIHNSSNTSLEKYQQNLADNELSLNFVEGTNHIFALKLSSNDVETLKIPKDELKELIEKHNMALLNNSQDSLLSASTSLLGILSLDNLNGIEKIIIIPDGILWKLNFNALVVDLTNNTSYLGNEFKLNYQYASTELTKEHAVNKNKSVIAFSFNEESNTTLQSRKTSFRNLNSSLPGTSKEVLSISQLMEGEYYYAADANETSFKQESISHGILHLAIHGFQDDIKPENSYLKFASADSLNDGKLHAYEIYNLNLNADLAVLSACHSGNGKIVAGEGMMSIGRAFSYAGVRSLLISRWEVSDYSAPHLMKYFYQGLKEGMYKSEALRYAQTQYLESHSDELTSSPFFWSSFYVLGDDSPIYERSSLNRWIIMLLVITLLGSLGVFLRHNVLSRRKT